MFAEEPLTATPSLQTYGKCFESVESHSGAESKSEDEENGPLRLASLVQGLHKLDGGFPWRPEVSERREQVSERTLLVGLQHLLPDLPDSKQQIFTL